MWHFSTSEENGLCVFISFYKNFLQIYFFNLKKTRCHIIIQVLQLLSRIPLLQYIITATLSFSSQPEKGICPRNCNGSLPPPFAPKEYIKHRLWKGGSTELPLHEQKYLCQ